MTSKKDIADAIEAIIEEWNLAEEAVKLAEQVCGEIINPAVYELRYAGRRLIEAFALSDSDSEKLSKLKDAHFDCCRARHDAMDAATSKVAADMDIAVEKLGAKNVLTNFPEISVLLEKLMAVRDKIAKSRGDRNNREKIYATIQENNLPEIVRLYSRFKASEELIVMAAAEENRIVQEANRKTDRSYIVAVISVLFAIIAIGVAIYFGVNN